jgi:hypothetical protein
MALTLVPMLGVALYRTILTAAERPRVFLMVTLAMLPLNGKRRLSRLTGAIEDRLIHSRHDWRRMGSGLCRKVRSFCWPAGGRLSNGWR